jgi:hypothetical protein
MKRHTPTRHMGKTLDGRNFGLLTWDGENGEGTVVDGREDHDAEEAHDVHLVEDLQRETCCMSAWRLAQELHCACQLESRTLCSSYCV